VNVGRFIVDYERIPGPVELAMLARLEVLGDMHSPLGATALVLARELDRPSGPVATTAREFRAILAELDPRRQGGDGDDELDELIKSLRHG